MFAHHDFHGPGAIAIKHAFKLDAALPDGQRLSNDGCCEADDPIVGAPPGAGSLPHWICERHKSPVGATVRRSDLLAMATAKAPNHSPTIHR
jgi:hypothetical protein